MTDETHSPEPGPEASATTVAEPVQETAAPEAPKAKLHQAVEIKDAGPCKKHVKVTIERKDIDDRLNEKFSELVVDTPVAGFRPGKAPRKVIERRFRKEVVEQVRAQLLMESLEQLAEDHNLSPISPPNIDPTKIDIPEKGELVYEFDVEVRPDFDLPNYKGMKLKRPVKTFTDADIARAERRLLAPYGQIIPKPAPEGGGAPVAELDDLLIVDMETRVGDQVVGTMKEIMVRVDHQLAFKDSVVENFAEKVKGAKAGDKRQMEITLTDAVADPALRGRKLQATLEIKDIKTVRLPELTHELCHEFHVHSPEQLRELIRAMLERQLEYQQRQAARAQVLAQITAASSWELPQDLLIRQARRALGTRIMEMRAAGMSDEQIQARQRLLERDVLQTTAMALKEHFVLQKIGEVEKIEINDDDINDEIDRIAAQTDDTPRRVRARLEKEDLLDALATEIFERKALDLVLKHAEYEDVPLDQPVETTVATVEAQAVPGQIQDPTVPPTPPAGETPPTP